MEQKYCITIIKKNKHLREKDRYKLELLLEQRYDAKKIATILGKHQSTIYREIKRGTVNLLQTDSLRPLL